MPQIAQQDYLLLTVPGDLDTSGQWKEQMWPTLVEKYKAGILFDIVLTDNYAYGRILGYDTVQGELTAIYYQVAGGVEEISKPE